MLKLEITNTGNAAFEDDNKKAELARIVRGVAELLEAGCVSGPCRDYNGNTVGQWEITDDD